MPLIKTFPSFSSETEKNIQADSIGEIFGLNLYLSRAGKDVYLEIKMPGGLLYERVTTIYNDSYNLDEELAQAKKKIAANYPDAQSVKDYQIKFYSDLWAQMVDGELVRNCSFLVSYTKYKIIFAENALTQAAFNDVLSNLKNKRLAQKEIELKEREEKNRIAEESRKQALEIHLNKVKVQILNDESIDGEELVDFCKDYGIDIHIRTQGTIKQKVSQINSGSYRVQRGTIFKTPPTVYYQLLREAIKEKESPEKNSPEVEKLFGKVA